MDLQKHVADALTRVTNIQYDSCMECRKVGRVGGCRLFNYQTTLLSGCIYKIAKKKQSISKNVKNE